MTGQPNAGPAQNTVALTGFIVGIVTAVAVLLRPFWLISDLLGIAAIMLGLIGVSMANRSGTGKIFAISAIGLGLTPLIPLLLVATTRLDYY